MLCTFFTPDLQSRISLISAPPTTFFHPPHQHHQLLSPIAQIMGRKKLTTGKFSHLPKSERPKMRDSKAVKDAKARKPIEGPPSKRQKGGQKEGDVKVKKVQASQANIIPFDVHDEILCVGEGLFSTYIERKEDGVDLERKDWTNECVSI
jgi:hypothetical protein